LYPPASNKPVSGASCFLAATQNLYFILNLVILHIYGAVAVNVSTSDRVRSPNIA
jgi:hypothetical protein